MTERSSGSLKTTVDGIKKEQSVETETRRSGTQETSEDNIWHE